MNKPTDAECVAYYLGVHDTILANPEILAFVEADIKSTGEYLFNDEMIKRAIKFLKLGKTELKKGGKNNGKSK